MPEYIWYSAKLDKTVIVQRPLKDIDVPPLPHEFGYDTDDWVRKVSVTHKRYGPKWGPKKGEVK